MRVFASIFMQGGGEGKLTELQKQNHIQEMLIIIVWAILQYFCSSYCFSYKIHLSFSYGNSKIGSVE